MSDNKRPSIDELLQRPPAEVMSMFQLDMRRLTNSIEGFIGLLKEADLKKIDLSEDQRDQIIDVMSRNVKLVRDGYDYILTYIEKLQESGKPNE